MAERDCWLSDRQIRNELRAFFSSVSRSVSGYLADHPSTREPHLDGHFVDSFSEGRFSRFDRRIRQYTKGKSVAALSMEFEARHVTAAEQVHGADIGLVVEVEAPGEMEITKAVLVQSKRLHPNNSGHFSQDSTFRELFKCNQSGDPQWNRMLRMTPASMYLFFGPDRLYLDRSFKEFGLRVIDAMRLKGMASAGASELTAQECFHMSDEFGTWIVDQFICCKEGDSTTQAISTALGDNPDFPVQHSVRLSIRRDELLAER